MVTFKTPEIGMKIKSILNSPRLESYGYVFCGTWKRKNGGYILTHQSWQNKKTGELISNDEFLLLAFTC